MSQVVKYATGIKLKNSTMTNFRSIFITGLLVTAKEILLGIHFVPERK